MQEKNEILKQFIDKKGWSQSRFGRKVGAHPTIVGRWFNNQAFPTVRYIPKIEILVGKLIEDIFPGILKDNKVRESINRPVETYCQINIEFQPFEIMETFKHDPRFEMEGFELKECVRKILATLTPREEKVLRMRFGIGEPEDHTLEEVSNAFSIERESVRRIEAKALRKLRHPTRSKPLKSFIFY